MKRRKSSLNLWIKRDDSNRIFESSLVLLFGFDERHSAAPAGVAVGLVLCAAHTAANFGFFVVVNVDDVWNADEMISSVADLDRILLRRIFLFDKRSVFFFNEDEKDVLRR